MYPGTDETPCIKPCDMDCMGCGMHDSCGYHYTDCTLLEPGDFLVPRGVAGYREDITTGPYDGPDLMAAEWERITRP
jgi:hypothetical protein